MERSLLTWWGTVAHHATPIDPDPGRQTTPLGDVRGVLS
jgi:hypothetical protein